MMVGRIWRAWATADNADAYEHLLRSKILPELDAEGCHGAYVLRREHRDEVEFVVLHFFDSIDAVGKSRGTTTRPPSYPNLPAGSWPGSTQRPSITTCAPSPPSKFLSITDAHGAAVKALIREGIGVPSARE